MVSMGLSLARGATATNVTMVVQLGFAMMPLCHFASSGLISGMMRGTSSRRRKALELSTNTAPASSMWGAKRWAMSFSAAPRTKSRPRKASSLASAMGTFSPWNRIVLPALRALARGRRLFTGKFRSANIFSISWPTAPVAPRTPTFISFMALSCLSVWILYIIAPQCKKHKSRIENEA